MNTTTTRPAGKITGRVPAGLQLCIPAADVRVGDRLVAVDGQIGAQVRSIGRMRVKAEHGRGMAGHCLLLGGDDPASVRYPHEMVNVVRPDVAVKLR